MRIKISGSFSRLCDGECGCSCLLQSVEPYDGEWSDGDGDGDGDGESVKPHDGEKKEPR